MRLFSDKHWLNDAPHVQAQPLVIYTSTKMDDAFVAALQKKGDTIGCPPVLQPDENARSLLEHAEQSITIYRFLLPLVSFCNLLLR